MNNKATSLTGGRLRERWKRMVDNNRVDLVFESEEQRDMYMRACEAAFRRDMARAIREKEREEERESK